MLKLDRRDKGKAVCNQRCGNGATNETSLLTANFATRLTTPYRYRFAGSLYEYTEASSKSYSSSLKRESDFWIGIGIFLIRVM